MQPTSYKNKNSMRHRMHTLALPARIWSSHQCSGPCLPGYNAACKFASRRQMSTCICHSYACLGRKGRHNFSVWNRTCRCLKGVTLRCTCCTSSLWSTLRTLLRYILCMRRACHSIPQWKDLCVCARRCVWIRTWG